MYDLYRSDTSRLPRDELGSRRSLIFLSSRVRLAPSLFFLSFCRETGSSPGEGTRVLQDFPVRWWSTHFITRITHDLRIVLDASRPKRRIKVMLLWRREEKRENCAGNVRASKDSRLWKQFFQKSAVLLIL